MANPAGPTGGGTGAQRRATTLRETPATVRRNRQGLSPGPERARYVHHVPRLLARRGPPPAALRQRGQRAHAAAPRCGPGPGRRTRLRPGRTRDHGEMEVGRGDGSAIAVEVAGAQDGRPVLFCHGLADSRLSAQLFGPAARELGLRLLAPDRPGIGRTGPRGLGRLADWAEDAALVLDAAAAGPAALLGISAGGPFAAACAARLGGRARSLTLIAPLGAPGWPARGMAPGQRLALQAARRAPAFGGWF